MPQSEDVDAGTRDVMERSFSERTHQVSAVLATGEEKETVVGMVQCVRRLPHSIANFEFGAPVTHRHAWNADRTAPPSTAGGASASPAFTSSNVPSIRSVWSRGPVP